MRKLSVGVSLLLFLSSPVWAQYSSANQDTNQNSIRYESNDNGYINDNQEELDSFNQNESIQREEEQAPLPEQARNAYNPDENGYVNRWSLNLLDDGPHKEEPLQFDHEGKYR